jgi:acyltransferase-like protein
VRQKLIPDTQERRGFKEMTTDTSTRRYELDWLRVLAIGVVFLYHSSRFFNLGDWHVKNIDTYVWVEIWNVFATRWMMPLFFIISGASLFYAMGKAGGFRKFYSDKFLRLMIPVLIASVTHSALHVYLERLTHGQFSGSLFSFLPTYFNGVYLGIGMPGNFAFHGMHLWYLLFLFFYSLICYPLFAWLKTGGHAMLNRLTSLAALPGLMYLCFPLPLLIMKALIPQSILDVGNGGWGFLYYLWFLMAGFMIASSDRLLQHIKNLRWVSLSLGMCFSAAYLYLMFCPTSTALPFSNSDWIHSILSFLSAWSWLFAILGLGMRFLCFDRPVLRKANQGVMPFYILHQTVLLTVGYFIMTWEIHDAAKWVIVFTSSLAIILILQTRLVQKFELLRFLFGMKTTRPFFHIFGRRSALVGLQVVFIGLIVFAAVNPFSQAGQNRTSMPLMYNPAKDILLNSQSISDQSSTGVSVVSDPEASIGRAIAFSAGANQRAESQPEVYFEMRFSAPAGQYILWLRGKCEVDNAYTDSVWLQTDDRIGTQTGSVRLGNWLDVHPAGVYTWASDSHHPKTVILKHAGDHTIRIQPRQIPHRIDQIWLSRFQQQIPNTHMPIE